MQICKISSQDPAFPARLSDLAEKTPESIYTLGELPTDSDLLVAIVGTRKMTPYGEQVTYRLASELAKAGVVIVSGLATGIDGVAHRAALDAGGRTIAVLGNPLDRIYPSQHRELAREILASGGALISELAVGERVQRWHFPLRNRLIVALSRLVIVTESGSAGGSLITAHLARDLGRGVMAVPGNITSQSSAGTNQLIHTGATPVFSITDVFQELGYNLPAAKPVPAQSRSEAVLMELIAQGQATNEQLIAASGLSAAEVANHVSLMEITGKIRNLGAGTWVLR
jgi:DNA processing protein